MDVQDELLSTFHRDRAPAVSLHNFIAEPREIDHLHAKMAFSSSAESRFFNNLESLFEIMNYSISLDGSFKTIPTQLAKPATGWDYNFIFVIFKF
ncbi:hypothetical protein T4B_11004 [Trichinella pseudospiralis]|uniref:Uncharacterized protein n=2 Tax=Trichinella pseudospiralis TaxID=6337 RepID=A0A0V1KEZ4_TRIPS|nr:hypothetical protein T4E_9534 [Trichinella pseudospiralis]KRY79106.1 hypothetical protein T4A_4911 [Trichinella pseudospiralis]KRY93885.1 hypothetical protein T4D_10174 [Trichinella pseudospiralis]KRZ32960.1 hypothetical protein T4B_11004 [Trichinella pseudospiralis]KRZ45676.1 hypothetical protein T4C_9156 [Trichinella pseudospiralis]